MNNKKILGIGLPPGIISQLRAQSHTHVDVACDPAEAFRLLNDAEFTSVIVHGTSVPEPEAVLKDLLGNTPLTTTIILLAPDLTKFDLAELGELGVKWITSAGQLDDLLASLLD